MANYPNRCQHLKINGTQCGSPALRRNRFCFFHKRFQDERIRLSADRARRGVATFVLPVLEDANSIQIALMQVMRLLVSQQIDHKTASLLLYALQTASTNLRMTNFKPFAHEVILDPRDVAETPLDSHIWDDEDFEEEEDETRNRSRPRHRGPRDRRARKKKRDEKWMRWAEMQYPDPRKQNASAAVTPAGNAVVTPASTPTTDNLPLPNLKKPASSSTAAEIRAEIAAMVRKELVPALAKKYLPDREGKQSGKEPEKKPT